jgi:hypothetical protein
MEILTLTDFAMDAIAMVTAVVKVRANQMVGVL